MASQRRKFQADLQRIVECSPRTRDALKVATCRGNESQRINAFRVLSCQFECYHGPHAVSHKMGTLPPKVLLADVKPSY